MKESIIQRGITDYLTMIQKQHNIYWFRAGSGAIKTEQGRYFKTGRPGCPDLIAIKSGKFIGLEVKTATGRQSQAQKQAEIDIKKAGGGNTTLSDRLAMSRQSFSLRNYQKKALDVIDHDLKKNDDPVLLQAIMGAGKTVIVARLINKYWFTTDMKFVILAHKQELVRQFLKTFKNMTDIPLSDVGICCSGLESPLINKRLTIGTIQTFSNYIDKYKGCSLLVIDEAHRISIGTNSQYDKTINKLNSKNKNMRILGITATPSRLGHGFIYGKKCRPGNVNLFRRCNYNIKYSNLKNKGYLVSLKGIVATNKNLTSDLAGIRTNGDYVLDQLGEIMSRERHLQTAVEAIRRYTENYKKICIFCCTIDHADQLNSLLGDEATIVHSQLTALQRYANMQAWVRGKKRIMVSVNILIEGFDFPELDCLVMARPTLSSALFLQAVGRVLRPSKEKNHGLLIDLTDNTGRFGTNLDKIKVDVPRAVEKQIKKEQDLIKLCPQCEKEVHITRHVCDCGFAWPATECVIAENVPNMVNVNFEPSPPEWHDVTGMSASIHTSKKTDKELGKITFEYGLNMYRPNVISMFFCLPDNYSGYAVERSREKWPEISDDPFPDTCEKFFDSSFYQPVRILIDMNGEYPEIKQLKMTPF